MPYKCIRCPGRNLPGFSKADLSIEMGFACPCLPLGFLVSAETGLHTILIGIGRISGATNEKAVVWCAKKPARLDLTQHIHSLPDAQCTMGLLLFAQWCRTNKIILACIQAGVNMLGGGVCAASFLQSAFAIDRGH